MPKRMKLAAIVVFSLLTVAVIGSEARSPAPHSTAAPVLQSSLIVTHLGRAGTRLARAWWR